MSAPFFTKKRIEKKPLGFKDARCHPSGYRGSELAFFLPDHIIILAESWSLTAESSRKTLISCLYPSGVFSSPPIFSTTLLNSPGATKTHIVVPEIREVDGAVSAPAVICLSEPRAAAQDICIFLIIIKAIGPFPHIACHVLTPERAFACIESSNFAG